MLTSSKLESQCSAKLAPTAAKGGHTITAARSLALSFASATTQVWLKLYLSAWCAQASARGLVLSLLAQCAAAGDAVQYSRTFAAWQFALHQSRLLRSTKRLASSNSRAQATVSLARSALVAWNSVVREARELDGAMSASLDAGSPLSGQTYCSAVCWSPAERLQAEAGGYSTHAGMNATFAVTTNTMGVGGGDCTDASSRTTAVPELASNCPSRLWSCGDRPQLDHLLTSAAPTSSQRPWAEGLHIRSQHREEVPAPMQVS